MHQCANGPTGYCLLSYHLVCMQHTAEIYWFCCFKVSEALAIIKLHPRAIKFNAVINTCDYFYSEHRLCGGTLRAEQTVKSSGGAMLAVSQPAASWISGPRTAISLIPGQMCPQQRMKSDLVKRSAAKTYMSDDINACSVLFIVILILMYPLPPLSASSSDINTPPLAGAN